MAKNTKKSVRKPRNDLSYKSKGKRKKNELALERIERAERRRLRAVESGEKEAAINEFLQKEYTSGKTTPVTRCFKEEPISPLPGDLDGIRDRVRDLFGCAAA